VIELNLTKSGARVLLALLTIAACALLALLIVSRFVIGTLADRRLQVTRAMLKIPVEYLPGSARLNARLAAAEFSEGDRDLASAKLYAERAVNLSPFDHRVWLTLASIEEAAGDRRAAEEALRTATELAPNYWSVHYRLGNLLVRERKLAESLEEFRKAIAANPERVPAHVNMGATLTQLGDLKGAAEEFEKTLLIDPNNTNAHYNLAVLLANENNHERAIAHLKAVTKINPNDLGARLLLVQQLAKLGRCDDAAELQQKLIEAGYKSTPCPPK